MMDVPDTPGDVKIIPDNQHDVTANTDEKKKKLEVGDKREYPDVCLDSGNTVPIKKALEVSETESNNDNNMTVDKCEALNGKPRGATSFNPADENEDDDDSSDRVSRGASDRHHEDPLIPDRGGGDDPSPAPSNPTRDNKRKYARTFCNTCALFSLGLIMAIKGPSFIDLQLISNTDVEQASLFFTACSFGQMLGCFLSGIIYTRIKVKEALMMLAVGSAALLLAVIPLCSNFFIMLLVLVFGNIFCGMFEHTANAEEFRSWEGNSGTALQLLNFAYSFGGITSPLILVPFLDSELAVDAANLSHVNSSAFLNVTAIDNTTFVYAATEGPSVEGDNTTTIYSHSFDFPLNMSLNATSDYLSISANHTDGSIHGNPRHSNILLPYVIVAIITGILTLPFLVLYIKVGNGDETGHHDEKKPEVKEKRLPSRVYVILIFLICSFMFIFTMIEDGFPQFLSLFVVTQLNWSKEDGAKVTSLFWAASTVSRLIVVFLTNRFNLTIILLVSTCGMTLAMVLFIFFVLFEIHSMIWVMTACLAMLQSSVYGGIFAWCDSNLLAFDTRVTSFGLMSAAVGIMLDPIIVGSLMEKVSPMAYAYSITAKSALSFFIFLFMLVFVRPAVTRRYGKPHVNNIDLEIVEKNLDKQDSKDRILNVSSINDIDYNCNHHPNENTIALMQYKCSV